MPYKFEYDKTPIPRDKDRRVKLTDEQRSEIRELNNTIGKQKIAKLYGVSKRLVQFICDPEKHKENIKRREERGGSIIYYNKEKNTKAVRKHRIYKNKVLKGEI